MIKLGNFKVTSGTVIVSDPCYACPTWCQGVLMNVKKGSWDAFVKIKEKEKCCGEIIAIHSDVSKDDIGDLDWELAPFVVGVDSGQAGIFDASVYQNDATVPEKPKFKAKILARDWYCMCCDTTLYTRYKAGVVPGGVVSQSGYGDGIYDAYLSKNKLGKIIAVKIVFIN